MDDLKLPSMIGNAIGTGGGLAVMMIVLWRLLAKIADRWIVSMDAVATRLAEHTSAVNAGLAHHAEVLVDALADHTATDLQHHAEVKLAVVRLESKLDAAIDWREHTPVRNALRDHTGPVKQINPDDIEVTTDSPSERRRRPAGTRGYRPPKPGMKDD